MYAFLQRKSLKWISECNILIYMWHVIIFNNSNHWNHNTWRIPFVTSRSSRWIHGVRRCRIGQMYWCLSIIPCDFGHQCLPSRPHPTEHHTSTCSGLQRRIQAIKTLMLQPVLREWRTTNTLTVMQCILSASMSISVVPVKIFVNPCRHVWLHVGL